MRHGKTINHLGRTAAHRSAMLANMACSLIEHKRINTTLAKAKALKQFIEPLITKSRASSNTTPEQGVHNRRVVLKNLRNREAVTELFGAVAEKVGERPGGYTRIIKLGNRLGDNADMAMIELVDFNELYNAGEKKKAKTTRRSRRGKGGGSEANPTDAVTPTAQAAAAEAVAATESEAVAEEVTEAIEVAETMDEVEPETAVVEVAAESEEAATEAVEEVADAAVPEAPVDGDEIADSGEAAPDDDEPSKT